MWMARAAALGLMVSISGLPGYAQDQRGFFLGAGWPGGGQVHLFENRGSGAQLGPSHALQLQTYQQGASLQRLADQWEMDPQSLNRHTPVQLQAGYDFGRLLGYLSLQDDGHEGVMELDQGALSIGISVPVRQNIQLIGEVSQTEANAANTGTYNIWSLSAGFRF